MNQPQPVFIFGCGNSGTSLLQGILGRHPDVYSQSGESSFYQFSHLYTGQYPTLDSRDAIHGMISFCANLITKGYRKLYSTKSESFDSTILSDDEIAQIRSTLSNPPQHKEVFPRTFDFLTVRAGKRIWVEKTPDHTHKAKQILTEIPNALAIEIVRDARDVLSSKKLREQKLKEKFQANQATDYDRALMGYYNYDPFWKGLTWKSTISAVNAARKEFGDRVLTIRYEDLTAEPQQTVRKICDFLGMEFSSEMLNANLENTADDDKLARKMGTGIISSSVGRYHKTLSRGEKALINRMLLAGLKQHNYDVPTLSRTDQLLAVLVLLKSLPVFFKRIANKIRYRGVRHTFDSLMNYVKRVIPA